MTSALRRIAALLSTGFILAACSSSSDGDTDAGAPSNAPTTASAPATTTSAAIDRTAELASANAGAAWLPVVTKAEEVQTGRLNVSTSIVDPRGANGSPAAQQAIQVCEAAVALLGGGDVHVSVYEADGTTFVLYGHPMVTAGTCGEV